MIPIDSPWRTHAPGLPLLLTLVVAGLALRVFHYARDPDVWIDEAALLVNVVELDYLQLTGRLIYFEAAPPLYLWLERTIVLLVGDGTYPLRLPAVAASVAALLLMIPLAKRLLPGSFVLVPLLLVAFSDRLLWPAAEAKPYSIDVMCAAGTAALFLLVRHRPLAARIGLFAGLAPLVIWLTYPGAFLYGGVLLAFLMPVLRSRDPTAVAAYVLLAGTVICAFALLVAGPVGAQRGAPMDAAWIGAFPDWQRPWAIPLWFTRQAFSVADYCFRPTGGLLLIPALLGARSLYRRGHDTPVVLLGVPVLLAPVAALMGGYPFSGSRVLVYAAPALAIFSAEGMMVILTWARKSGTRSVRFVVGAVLAGVVTLGIFHTVRPRPRPETGAAARYVRSSRLPTDTVASFDWEYRYYFRDLRSHFVPMGRMGLPGVPRVWLIVNGDTAAIRRRISEHLAVNSWATVEGQEFERVTVSLLINRQVHEQP